MEQNANALPKVTLGQYKGLEFTRRVRPVSEKAVELEAANLTRTRAPFAPVEKSAARGMRVTLDFEGFMDGAPIPESKMENVTVVLGTGQLMPAAEDAVYGHKAGESFRFDFTYPAEFRVRSFPAKRHSSPSPCTPWSKSSLYRWTMPLPRHWALIRWMP
mgnify:CR=1 FL=1